MRRAQRSHLAPSYDPPIGIQETGADNRQPTLMML
jgi:hypothetical protein